MRFDRLSGLENKAQDVVEVNIDGKLLDLAKRVMVKVNDPNSKKIGQAISGLKGIYVRVYNFEKENEYSVTDIDEIRSQLNQPGWRGTWRGQLVHQAARLRYRGITFSLAVLTDGNPSQRYGIETIAGVTRRLTRRR